MKRLIINADDLGISLEVNKEIENCIQRGLVTSSTLMANAPAFDDGVRIAKQYPKVSVGVHLNLIEFSPLTNLDVFKKHGIAGEDGDFIEGAITCVAIDEELKQAVFEEWDAQISKVESMGLLPTHCDSHEHTHTITTLQGTLCKVLEKHNIRCVRRKIEPSIILMLRARRRPAVQLDKSMAKTPPKKGTIYRRLHIFDVIKRCKQWNVSMSKRFTLTDGFCAFENFYYDRKVLEKKRRLDIVELMCHPGHTAYQRETDNMLQSQTLLQSNYHLISYHEL